MFTRMLAMVVTGIIIAVLLPILLQLFFQLGPVGFLVFIAITLSVGSLVWG